MSRAASLRALVATRTRRGKRLCLENGDIMSDASQGYGWWQAADGKWYPPEAHPDYRPATPAYRPPTQSYSQVLQAGPAPTPKKPLWRRWWFIATAALLVVVVIAGIAAPPKDEETTANTLAPVVGSVGTDATAPVASEPTAASSTAPATSPPVTAPPATESSLTPAQQNAVRSAESYLDFMAFSRQGLIDQLSSEYGDQFAVEDATVAVDSLNVDWNAQAVKSAQSYLDMMGFSCQGLIDQLSSDYGDQYTVEQAIYGATQVGIC